MLTFHKYHGLGNDYLVLDPKERSELPVEDDVRIICHRNYGLGSDGILYGPLPSKSADFKLRIINPDASEAEKSGNGLRIFAKYLFDQKQVEYTPFTVETLGGVVKCQILDNGNSISVDMGKVTFQSTKIPMTGPDRNVLNEPLQVGDSLLHVYAANIGNPHCVIPLDSISSEMAKRLGPKIENHPSFPKRINVQFLKIIDRNTIQIEIWERGAGYTLASGSSSSAAGAVAKKMGEVDESITVRMPGGEIKLKINDSFEVNMIGPATFVGVFQLAAEALQVALPKED